jgi:hypothetical protein
MEVHHHPDLHHRKKHFKEYLLEFLMIFLAVTLGFLSENVREHIADRSKEKEYIRGFISNVQDDTATLKHVINFDNMLVKGIDSFLQLRHADLSLDSNRKKFYLLAINYFYRSASFISNSTTLQQLKNTGDYRLIAKDHVADSLSKYDNYIQDISAETNYYNDYFKEILSRLDGLTDMSVYQDTSYLNNGVFTNKPLPAFSTEPNQLLTLFNKITDFRLITGYYASGKLQPQLEIATRLISFLRTEYDIENQ